MADQESSLSGQQSLDIIHEMIGRAKGSLRESSFYILLWAWIVLAGSLGHYLLLQYTSVQYPQLAWGVIFIGIIASFVKGYRDRSQRGASTYSSRLIMIVWIIFLVNYFIIVPFIGEINYNITPLVLIMTAGSTYLSGAIIKFTPLKWGAVFIWLMAIVSFLVSLPYQLLATTAAILVGFLIPGYILKNSEE